MTPDDARRSARATNLLFSLPRPPQQRIQIIAVPAETLHVDPSAQTGDTLGLQPPQLFLVAVTAGREGDTAGRGDHPVPGHVGWAAAQSAADQTGTPRQASHGRHPTIGGDPAGRDGTHGGVDRQVTRIVVAQGSNTVEPVVCRASSTRCASAASLRAKLRPTSMRTLPDWTTSNRSCAVATKSSRLAV